MVKARALGRGRRWARLLLGGAAAALILLTQPASAFGGPGVPGHSHVWGYEASGGLARLLEYNIDPTTSLITPGLSCVPVPSGNGRAVAHDPNAPPQPPFAGGEVLWYQYFGFTGRIFKATLPSALPPCQPRGSIPFGEGPGPPNQDNIGALDLDTDDANILWAAGYIDVPATGFPEGGGPFLMLFKVDKTNGQILGRCKSLRGGLANDTLTVANLPTVGKVLLTDFGDPYSDPLVAVDPASLTGPPAPAPAPDCREVATYTTPTGETGIDWGTLPKPLAPPEESLLATDLFNWFDLDQPPFATARPMGSTAGALVEDISLLAEEACPPEDDDDDNGDDGRRDDDDDEDEDDDGLTDENESLFLTLLGNRDSDLDGIVDGNDDGNGNGEDDEDEDDDECPDDDDSDGDGVDDEDEDDDDDDD